MPRHLLIGRGCLDGQSGPWALLVVPTSSTTRITQSVERATEDLNSSGLVGRGLGGDGASRGAPKLGDLGGLGAYWA